MEILIAFDSFKGCLSSQAAGEAFARGVRSEGATCRVLTMSDGGDGMLDAFLATLGGDCITIACHDALMRRIEASYGLCGQRAIIEVAQACGLSRIELENRNPLVATSYGVGELLADAVMRGAKECVIGLGGTATSDCGIGMIRALIEHLGRSAHDRFDAVRDQYFQDLRIVLASDVRNPLCGPLGAARVFAPQKGATEAMVEVIDRRAARFADVSARHFGYDLRNAHGAGAAGGLGYAFMEYFQATMCSGAELLLGACHFDEMIDETAVIVTGEGSSDAQTLMGKLPLRGDGPRQAQRCRCRVVVGSRAGCAATARCRIRKRGQYPSRGGPTGGGDETRRGRGASCPAGCAAGQGAPTAREN